MEPIWLQVGSKTVQDGVQDDAKNSLYIDVPGLEKIFKNHWKSVYLVHLGSSILGGSWGSVPQLKLFGNGPESNLVRRILC